MQGVSLVAFFQREVDQEVGEDKTVSVIIPVYNVSVYLDACIKSVVSQSYGSLEILLVDDGSTDDSGCLCDRWASREARIRVIHKRNGGLSSARNAGLDVCTGDYIAFVDSDDWIEPGMIEEMINALDVENADYCACGIISHFDQEGRTAEAATAFFSGDSTEALQRLYDQTRFPVSSWAKLVKSSCWGGLRFPEGKLYEDAFTTYKVIHAANRIVQIPNALYHYRIRANSIMTSPFSLDHVDVDDAWRENYLFCDKYYPEVSNAARAFWLEHLPGLLEEFPSDLSEDEIRAKQRIKCEIRANLMFALLNMPIKKFINLASVTLV